MAKNTVEVDIKLEIKQATAAIAKTIKAIDKLGKRITTNFGQTEKVIRTTSRAVTALGSTMGANFKKNQSAINKTTTAVETLGGSLRLSARKNQQALKDTSKETKKLGKQMKKSFSGARQAFNIFAGLLTANIVTNALFGIKNAARDVFDIFLELEKAQVGVAKTTNISSKALLKLRKEIDKISSSIPVSSTELLNLATVAGQLGVRGNENLLKFTETVSKLTFATDLAGTEGATSLIRILNVTGEGVSVIDRFASAIVALGNSVAATESEIVSVANEVARSTIQFKIGSANVAGISATLRELGIQARLGGSVVGKAFRVIEDALIRGGKKLKALEQITGMTGDQLRKTFKEDSTAVFTAFVEGLGRVNAKGGSVSATMAKLSLIGDEVNKVLPAISINASKLATNLELSNRAFEANIALNEEARKAFDTLGSEIKVFSNLLSVTAQTIFREYAPAIQSALETANSYIRLATGQGTATDKLNQGIKTQAYVLEILEKRYQGQISSLEALEKKYKEQELVLGLLGKGRLAESKKRVLESKEAVLNTENEIKKHRELLAAFNAKAGKTNVELAAIDSKEAFKELEKQLDNSKKAVIGLESKMSEFMDIGADQSIIKAIESQIIKERQLVATLETKRAKLVEVKKIEMPVGAGGDDPQVKAAEERNKKLLEKDAELRLERQRIQEENALITEEAEVAKLEALEVKSEDELKRIETFEIKKLTQQQLAEERKIALIEDTNIREAKLENSRLKFAGDMSRLRIKITEDEAKATKAIQELERLKTISILSTTANAFQAFGQLAAAASGDNWKITKAFALASIPLSTAVGIMRAMELPPPVNWIQMAAVGALGAAQLIKVATQKPPAFQDGGIVPGNQTSGDNITARVNSKEMILNQRQQGNLFSAIDSGNVGGGGMSKLIDALMSQPIIVEMDGTEVARATRSAMRGGFVLA